MTQNQNSSNALIRFGLPKGSLQNATIDLFKRAGFNVSVPSRSYFPTIDDSEIEMTMFRAQEMSRYVEDGVIDIGITGADWVVENDSDVHEVCELAYSKATSKPAQWVIAVPEESDVYKAEDLAGGIISTELVNTTQRFFEGKNVPIKKVEFSWGATEVKARLVDAIVDITETGSSLRANRLRIIDTVMTSTTRLICSNEAWADDKKRAKIEDLALLLQGAINARRMVGLKLNVHNDNLAAVVALLPAEKSPTVSSLAQDDYRAVEIIVDERVERELVPQLRRAGASGIFSYPLNKVIV